MFPSTEYCTEVTSRNREATPTVRKYQDSKHAIMQVQFKTGVSSSFIDDYRSENAQAASLPPCSLLSRCRGPTYMLFQGHKENDCNVKKAGIHSWEEWMLDNHLC